MERRLSVASLLGPGLHMFECEDLVVEIAAFFKAGIDLLEPILHETGRCDLQICIPLLSK